jgi:hypothetical protein
LPEIEKWITEPAPSLNHIGGHLKPLEICIMDDQELDLEYTDALAEDRRLAEDGKIENFYLALTYALARLKEFNPAPSV